MGKNEQPERVKVLHTMDRSLKDWVAAESKSSGRSESYLIENAVRQWKDRIEKGRKL